MLYRVNGHFFLQDKVCAFLSLIIIPLANLAIYLSCLLYH